VRIRKADDGDAAAVVALLCAADDARVVSPDGWRYSRATAPERARLLQLVADSDGRIVATGAAGLNTMTTTPGAAWAFVAVAEPEQRQGIGSAIGETLLEHLRGLEAKKVTSFMRFTEVGERWAQTRGFTRVLTGPLIAVDPRAVAASAPPPGFRCAAMSELAPEAVYAAVCEAALDEPSALPNDDIRLDEFLREWREPDVDLDSSAAVLRGDRVVAFAFLQVVGERGQHGFTGTLREYRGQGLATAAKRFALRAAAERGVTRVTTSNAEGNEAMRAINRRLGFEQIGEHVIMALDLE
jgi:GNAT superfamily N-acetyltransferase